MDNYDQITQTLRAYEADAPGVEKFIRDSILGAVDSYRPELESVRNYEQSQLCVLCLRPARLQHQGEVCN